MITKRQKQVLDFVVSYHGKKGYAPTLHEICKKFKFASVSTAHFHITRLKNLGLLSKRENHPRAIEAIGRETVIRAPLLGATTITARSIEATQNREPIVVSRNDVFPREEGSVPMSSPKRTERERYRKLPMNKIICGDAVEIMKKFPSNSVDIVVTSPPYDAVRDYRGFSLDLHAAGKEIHRVLKDGGIAVMVIQDQTKNFGKSLTSFKTIIDWCDSFGFKLFETVIYRKYGAEGAWWNKRFRVDHEYIPIFLKGERPQYFNKEHLKIPSKHGGKTMTGGGTRLTNGIRIATRAIKINPMKCRGTIWEYLTAGDGSRLKHQHPATFPNQLPYDFISCFAPKNGVVLDPFVGSGTTTVAAKNLGYKYIGIDIAPEYCAIAEKRIEEECMPTQRRLL